MNALKKLGWALLAVSCLTLGRAQTAADKITAGRAALAAHNPATAQARFQEALDLNPSAQVAAAFLGLTRCFTIVNWGSSQSFMNRIGMTQTGRDVYRWKASLTYDGGYPVFPANLSAHEAADFWNQTLIPESERARSSLALVTNPSFLISLTTAETGLPAALNIDYGDVLLMRASLRGAEFFAHISAGQDLHANITQAVTFSQGGFFTLQRFVADNPDFLRAGPLASRLAARAALVETIALYRQGSEFIRARPAGLSRLYMIEADQLGEEAEFRTHLDKLERSLSGLVEVNDEVYATLAPVFTADWSLRAALPTFSATGFDLASFTDSSLGGVVQGITRERMAAGLTKQPETVPELGWEWVSPSTPGNDLVRYLALPGGKHLIGGAAGTLLSSSNGTTWTTGRITGAGTISGLAMNAGKIVAAAGNGIYLSSDSGLTWKRTVTAYGNMLGVAFGGGRFVVVGNRGTNYWSEDGEKWYQVYSSMLLQDVVHDGARFVAVGMDANDSRAAIAVSSNGSSWTVAYKAPAQGYGFSAIARGGNRVVVVGSANAPLLSIAGGAFAPATIVSGGNSFGGVTYYNGSFIAVGELGAVSRSADGSSWTGGPTGDPATFLGVGAATDAAYIVGTSGVVLRSTDGQTFSRVVNPQTIAPASANFYGLLATDTHLYVTGSQGTLLRSADGQSFTPLVSGTTNALWSMIQHNGVFYAVGDAGTILRSTDGGTTWTKLFTGDFTQNFRSISRLNNLFVVTGSDGLVLTSSNGSGWSRTLFGVQADFYGAAYGNSRYVVVGSGTGISGTNVLTSTTGVSWTAASIGYGWPLRGVVFANGRFTAVGSDGAVLHSVDGIDWEFDSTGASTDLSAIRVIDGCYYAIQGTTSTRSSSAPEPQTSLVVSSEARYWVSVPQGTAVGEYAIEKFQNRIYVAGNAASLLRTQVLPVPAVPALRVLTPGRELQQGGDVILSVVANSATPAKYQWTKNGNPIFDATTPTLSLTNVQAGDAGTYALVVTNVAGSVTSAPIVLTVNAAAVAPTLVSQPTPQTAAIGLSVTFSVAANGTAPFTYQWKKDGVNVPSGNAATLALVVSATTAGVYTVVVTNAGGSATSTGAALTLSPDIAYTFSTLAGTFSVSGAADGVGAAASFYYPHGIAVDGSGNIYVADMQSHTLRRITPAGVVTTLAGNPGSNGNTNGIGNAARFSYPTALVLSADGNTLFVADSNNNAIRQVNIPTRAVTTYATGMASLQGLARHANGTLYATSGHAICAISTAGVVTVVAGNSGAAGLTNGIGTAARFNSPRGLALDSSNRLYVADGQNGVIRRVELDTGVVTTYAGAPGMWGGADGALSQATFAFPTALAWDPAGSLFVGDMYSRVVRRIAAGRVLTIGGELFEWGYQDGVGRNARFGYINGIATDAAGNLYLADTYSQTLRKGVPSASPLLPILGVTAAQQAVALNGFIILSPSITGGEPMTYQWFRDGASLPDQTRSTLTLFSAVAGDAGKYSIRVTNPQGTVLLPVTTLQVTTTTAGSNGLLASSTRTHVGTGAAILTGVFTVEGSGPKEMLVRAVGPGLAVFGVSGTLADPQIEIIDATTGAVVATNDDWGLAANASAVSVAAMRVGAFPLSSSSRDAVYFGSFAPGTYRVNVRGANASAGLALLEIYDADLPPRLVYTATRAVAGTGADELFSGFVVNALPAGRSYLVRAIGPSLGVPGALADPQLFVRDSMGTLVASNDDWAGSLALVEKALVAGAMPLEAQSKDAVVNFQPSVAGSYTASVRGANNSSGLALLEVFEVDADRAVAVAPAIVSQPASVSVPAGQPATFGVVVTGKPAPAFQWRREGTLLLGKTNSLLRLPAVQSADAGAYDVLVSNSQGAVVSTSAALGVGPASGSFGTHAVAGPGYVAGQTVTIINTLNYVGSPTTLGWEVTLPAGWSYVASAGEPGDIKPVIGDMGKPGWAWTSFPASPIRFSYTVSVPPGETVARTLSANAIVRLAGDGSAQVIDVSPAALEIQPMRAHSADVDQDFRIALGELLRVIQLYNVRRDTARTGAYALAATASEDGFAPDPLRTGAAPALSRYHAADTNRDGRIDLTELTRVIELFNYRSGSTRTGAYRLQSGTEDGFAAGP